MIKIHTLKNLQQRDVFELMSGDFKNEHWHESSIFLTEEAFAFLHLHIYKVLSNFNYFGPNSVNLKQWNQIAFIACTLNNSMDIDFIRFFNKIDDWEQKNFEEHTCFSICGP